MAHQGLGAVLRLICYAAMLCSNCMTRGLEQHALVQRHFCSKKLLRRAACACKRSAGNEISSADGTTVCARYGMGQQNCVAAIETYLERRKDGSIVLRQL